MNPASFDRARDARRGGGSRSAWVDEFFMVNVTGPNTPWQDHYSDSWNREPHPPTYSMILWLWRQIVEVENSIFALRVVGVAITACAMIGALYYWRRSELPGFRAFAFVLFATAVLLYYPQETRSYFLGAIGGLYCATALPLGVALSFALGVVSLNHIRLSTEWREPAVAVNAVAECDGATIPYLILSHPPDERNIWRSHYEWYAPNHDYQPALPEVLAQAATQQCPVRLWIAHQVQRGVDPALKAAVSATCAGGARVGLEFADGYLVVDESAQGVIQSWDGPVVPCDEMVIELPGG